MVGRYRPAMDLFESEHQAPEPRWTTRNNDVQDVQALRNKITELEEKIQSYETLLADLPDLFERKFQPRLEPLLERYRLLAQQTSVQDAGKPALVSGDEGKVIRFPIPRVPTFLRRRDTSA